MSIRLTRQSARISRYCFENQSDLWIMAGFLIFYVNIREISDIHH